MKIFKRGYYEKLLATKPESKTVQQHQLDIQESHRKIEELQSRCPHDSYEVVMFSWRPGNMSPSHVCVGCRKNLGPATEEEAKKLWDEYNSQAYIGGEK